MVALVTDAPWKTVRPRLLDQIEAPPPVVERTRSGKVVDRDEEYIEVVIKFEDGTREVVAHPFGVSVRRRMPIRESEFKGHEGPIVFWGKDHIPHRHTERLLQGHG
jgi:hypothetical protein